MRIILYTGKGGVGKTSVAAATALRCAELGHRTIIVSTDAAHSLGDSFDMQIGNEPVELAPNLKGQEIDVLHQLERYWGTIQDWMNSMLKWRGVNELIADEASILPGMDELASLLQIVTLRRGHRRLRVRLRCERHRSVDVVGVGHRPVEGLHRRLSGLNASRKSGRCQSERGNSERDEAPATH